MASSITAPGSTGSAPVRVPIRVPVALPPGAATLLGSPTAGGFVWAAGFATLGAAVVALVLRALSTPEADR